MEKIIITVGFEKSCFTNLYEQVNNFNFKLENYELVNDINIDEIINREYTMQFVIININHDPYAKFKFAASLKEYEYIETIFISKDADPDERVRWLSFGACNYFLEPYSAEEILRFATFLANKKNYVMSDRNFIVDLKKKNVLYQGEKIEVSDRMMSLIIYIMEHSDTVISREDLLSEVFDGFDNTSIRNVDTSIKNLRKVTKYDVISTIRGKGYLYNS